MLFNFIYHFVIIEFCYADRVALYMLLAGACLSAHLLLCVESLPLRLLTTTESPPISPATSSDTDDTFVARAESTSDENPDQLVVPSSSHDSSGSLASHVYAILTILNHPTLMLNSEQPREDPNLPVSSAVVSSSTASLSEENCSSNAVQPGPCRKRSASTDELANKVFSHMIGNVKRMKEENPSASTSNWPFPDNDDHDATGDSGEISSHHADSQQRDSGSSSPSDSNESTSSSSESPPPHTTHM
jgi:hypothetical protein